MKHSPYMSQSPKTRLNSSPGLFSLFSLLTTMWQVGGWLQLSTRWFCRDISSSFSQQLLPAESRTNWALHVRRQVNCQPAPNSGSAQKLHLRCREFLLPHSLCCRPGPCAGPVRNLSNVSAAAAELYQHKVSKPQRPTPALIRARDKARKGQLASKTFFGTPHQISGRGWALGWGLFLLNKQTFLGKAQFLESSYPCQQPSQPKWVT